MGIRQGREVQLTQSCAGHPGFLYSQHTEMGVIYLTLKLPGLG